MKNPKSTTKWLKLFIKRNSKYSYALQFITPTQVCENIDYFNIFDIPFYISDKYPNQQCIQQFITELSDINKFILI